MAEPILIKLIELLLVTALVVIGFIIAWPYILKAIDVHRDNHKSQLAQRTKNIINEDRKH